MEEEDNIEKCVICENAFTIEMPKAEVGEKGIQSLLKFSRIRKNEVLEKFLTTRNKESPVVVHRDCRRNFTDIKRSLKTKVSADGDEESPTSTKRSRSSIESFNWKTHASFVQKMHCWTKRIVPEILLIKLPSSASIEM